MAGERIIKPCTVTYGGVPLIVADGVSITGGHVLKYDNAPDQQIGNGGARITGVDTTITMAVANINADTIRLMLEGRVHTVGQVTTIYHTAGAHNAGGIVTSGVLSVSTRFDDNTACTILADDCMNCSAGDLSAIGSKQREYSPTFPLNFKPKWASDTEGDYRIVIDKTPTTP